MINESQAQTDERFMRIALEEAAQAAKEGEIPIGAVIVVNGKVIARAHNLTETLKDVTAHAEIMAITSASSHLGGKYLPECTLYVTVEPCLMCAGAIGWSQLGRIVYGTADEKRGALSHYRPAVSPFHPKARIEGGVLENECKAIMQDFFKKLRR